MYAYSASYLIISFEEKTEITHIHLAVRVKKFFDSLMGVQEVFRLAKGGVKKCLTPKIFNCSAPHQSIYEHSPGFM